MGRGRFRHMFHGRSPEHHTIAGLIGSAHAVIQPVVPSHQSRPSYQKSSEQYEQRSSPPRTSSSSYQDAKNAPPETPATPATPDAANTNPPLHHHLLHRHHEEPNKRDPGIWARAFHHFMESRPELAAYYAQHVHSLGDSTGVAPEEERPTGNSRPSTLQTIDLIVKKLHQDREQRQWKIPLAGKDIKIREQAEKLAKFLLWSDPIVKDALSAQPYAALAWSGVSFLLSLLTTGTSQHTSMLQGFEVVNDTLVYWHICEETYLSPDQAQPPSKPSPEHTSLATSLSRLYALLIEYQALAIAHLSRSQLARAFEKVIAGSEWTDRIAQIEVENERCRRMIDPVKESQIQEKADASYRVMMESKEILSGIREAMEESKGMMQRHYEDQLERGLLHDLALAVGEYEGYKNLGNPKRVEGTCEWFFGDADFRNWREAEEGVLWVTAGPGCGKSVLARALVDERGLTTRVTTTSVAHFFFKKGDGRRVSAPNALAAVMHQLFTQDGGRRDLIDDALRRHRSYGPALATNFNELWQILAHYVASPGAGEVVCVLDALDECDERDREMLLERIRDFYQRRKAGDQRGKLKFFITSRPHDGIEAALGRLSRVGALVHIDGDGLSREIGDEINLVIDDKLSTITASFSEQDRKRISDKLKAMKHRTYLWLHLTLDIIEKAPSRFCRARDLESFLAKLPSEVSEAYEQVLSHSTDRHQTETLLNLVVAAQRPLTLDEANIALTLALDDPTPTTIDELNPWPRDRFKAVVQRLCGLFVTAGDGKLSLIHQTARDFLLSPHRSPNGEWKGCLSLPEPTTSHVYLDPKEYQSLQQQHAFLSYAAAHWPTHHRAAETPSATSANPPEYDALALCKPANNHVWAPQHFSRGSFLRWWTWTDLALASYVGLASTVEALISATPPDDKNNGLNAKCSDFGTPLQTAAAGGHENVVGVLLERGAEVDGDEAGASGHGTALRIAAARGHAGIVAMLLQAGADANIRVRSRGQGTALEAARAGGHQGVVQMLNKVPDVSSILADDDDVEAPLLPTWFGHDDFEVEPGQIEMPRWDSAHMPAWVDGEDYGVVDKRLAVDVWPVIVPSATPIRRAMALQYMADEDDEIELLDFENEKRMTGGVALSIPCLKA
ncbi:hypothetical protein QBC34DRAFT_468419 [Podospora aff. communis PSN243]|uniref:NWD NACHT-NTPase N-terminal domain-containing protein n=1 Tax=Podospora aff. communis PSN243 TaxID=3040156 RepID=A0AAV9GGS4_9PEZI|nr:hypothetical protein QBC34DRAFT_468419 [Podospora aff. communis PSN243]